MPKSDARPLIDQVASHMKGSFDLAGCDSKATCLSAALATPAKQLTVVYITHEQAKVKGFWVADVKVNVSVRRLSDNALVYQSEDLAARVMSRQQHQLNMAQAIEKWLTAHQDVINKLAGL